MLLWSGDVFTLMHERPEFCAVLVSLESDHGVRAERSFKPRTRYARLVSELRKPLSVSCRYVEAV